MNYNLANLKYRTPDVAVIFDDEQLIADCLQKTITGWQYFRSVYAFHNEIDLLHFFTRSGNSGSVLLYADYYIGNNKTIIPVISEIRRLCKKVRIVIVSSISNPVLIRHLLLLRVDAVLSKFCGTAEFRESTGFINSGTPYTDSYTSNLLNQDDGKTEFRFSDREVEILHYTSEGYTVDETAGKVHLSRHTVAAHRRNMMKKAGCSNVVELLAYARNIDLI